MAGIISNRGRSHALLTKRLGTTTATATVVTNLTVKLAPTQIIKATFEPVQTP